MKLPLELMIYVENRHAALKDALSQADAEHLRAETSVGTARLLGQMEELRALIAFLREKNREEIKRWEVKINAERKAPYGHSLESQ